jgi:hypothetical protein
MKPTSKFSFQSNSYITFGCIKNYLFYLNKHMTYLHKYHINEFNLIIFRYSKNEEENFTAQPNL